MSTISPSSFRPVADTGSYGKLITSVKKRRYERIVFTNGCFDVLHPGHVQLLMACRTYAGPKGAVVVGLNSDESVRKLKGPTRPIIGEAQRSLMLLALRFVDHVIVFEEETPRDLIDALRPDLIVKGEDYRDKVVVGSDVAPVVLVPIAEGFSTTAILERMQD